MNFKLRDLSDSKKITKKFNNGDFDYYLIIETIDLTEIEDKPDFNYLVEIAAVSISEAKEHLKRAFECIGLKLKDFENNKLVKAEALHDYGVKTCLWSKLGNNQKQLMKEARNQIMPITTLFGFYMDKNQNMIGNNGWDFIKGDIGFK